MVLPAARLSGVSRRRPWPARVARIAPRRAQGLRPFRLERSAAPACALVQPDEVLAAAHHAAPRPMALYGVLGDIHGNLEALRAVLAALDERGVRALLCLGDVVGYNADADACAALPRQRGARVILGNHDLIATRRLGFECCANKARYALARTRRTLARETADWLATLPERLLVDGEIALVHGGVRDVQLYMHTPQIIAANSALLR